MKNDIYKNLNNLLISIKKDEVTSTEENRVKIKSFLNDFILQINSDLSPDFFNDFIYDDKYILPTNIQKYSSDQADINIKTNGLLNEILVKLGVNNSDKLVSYLKVSILDLNSELVKKDGNGKKYRNNIIICVQEIIDSL